MRNATPPVRPKQHPLVTHARFGPGSLPAERAHHEAVHRPRRGIEAGLVDMVAGVQSWVDGYTEAWSDPWPDYVATPELGAILEGIVGLLNMDRGRLDGAAVSTWANHVAEVVGWDMDTSSMAQKERWQYTLQGWYTAETGWEDLTTEATREEAEQRLREYEANDRHVAGLRIRKEAR